MCMDSPALAVWAARGEADYGTLVIDQGSAVLIALATVASILGLAALIRFVQGKKMI